MYLQPLKIMSPARVDIDQIEPSEQVRLFCPEAPEPQRRSAAYVGMATGAELGKLFEQRNAMAAPGSPPLREQTLYAAFVMDPQNAPADKPQMLHLLRVENPATLRDDYDRAIYIERAGIPAN